MLPQRLSICGVRSSSSTSYSKWTSIVGRQRIGSSLYRQYHYYYQQHKQQKQIQPRSKAAGHAFGKLRFLTTKSSSGDRIRVAIVGGGAAGLSTALHLAPLVSAGYINGPIDVYEASLTGGREIGVGIWSTALDPFFNSPEDSHQLVYQDMVQKGSFVKDVGYRTPKGHWLATSRLSGDNPDLLFLREKDFLGALRKAVHLEEHRGTVAMKCHSKISSIAEDFPQPWSAPLVLEQDGGGDGGQTLTTTETERDYHLIVAADGMNSVLRKLYGGHIAKRGKITTTGPLELAAAEDMNPRGGNDWYVTGQAEATSTQDRNYTVFRGSAPLSRQEMGLDKSFQTWGEGHSMRFATVPMICSTNGKKQERQVWFITINDDDISNTQDPHERREKLLKAFEDWHDPIGQLVTATPPEEILMERAMAHKHSLSPVANFNAVVQQIRQGGGPVNNESSLSPASSSSGSSSGGNGPALVFVGDAFMTVDPILAQGFTIGMEGAAALRTSLETSLATQPTMVYPQAQGRPPLAFDPYALRVELKHRHDARLSRLIHLLRATELVQALGQPTSGTLSGWISRDILRPLMRLTPSFIKTPIFNAMMKYSLGLPIGGSSSRENTTTTKANDNNDDDDESKNKPLTTDKKESS